MFDALGEARDNFINTANLHTNGTSEKYVGELIASDRKKLGRRNQVFSQHGQRWNERDRQSPSEHGASRRSQSKTHEYRTY
jgi:aryl-alcohol dehydrogenase-like predicted oxidoreductase